MSTLSNTIISPIRKIKVKITLLFRASHSGRKISKLSFSELEYFLARMVKGQNILNKSNTMPSPKTNPIAIHA